MHVLSHIQVQVWRHVFILHEVVAADANKDGLQDMKKRFELLEKLLDEKILQISAFEDELAIMKNENTDVKAELNNMNENVKNVIEGAVTAITEAVVKQFTSNQLKKDEEYERRFNTLCEQLEIVVQIIKNQSVSAPPVQNSSLPQLERRQVKGNNARGQ